MRKECGRLVVEVDNNGMIDHAYAHGVTVSCLDGWNNSSRPIPHIMSVEELRDLHYMIGRAIAAADDAMARWRQSNEK